MSAGFFDEEQVKNVQADEPWKKSERDWVLDTYLAAGEGATPKQMAQKLGRNPKALVRLVQQFCYNEQDRVIHYEPFRRLSRKGKKFTQNELSLWRALADKQVPPAAIAKVLQRDVNELTHQKESTIAQQKSATPFAPTLDLIWAFRCAHALGTPLISDDTYDDLVKEEIEFGGGGPRFARLKAFVGWPPHVRALVAYLTEKQKFEKVGGLDNILMYMIGEKVEEGEYQMWWGPEPGRTAVHAQMGKSNHSYILVPMAEQGLREIARWSMSKQMWVTLP